MLDGSCCLFEEQIRRAVSLVGNSSPASQIPQWKEAAELLVTLEIERFRQGCLDEGERDDLSHEKIRVRAEQRLETVLILPYVLKSLQPYVPATCGTVLELCCGDSGLGILLAGMGYQCCAIDVSRQKLEILQKVAALVLGESVGRYQVVERSALLDPPSHIEEKTVWLACHPCSVGVNMPDRIIRQWIENPSAKGLILIPCCPRNWKDDYPGHMEPWVADRKLWCELCSHAQNRWLDDIPSRIRGQQALEQINAARVSFLQSTGASASWQYIGYRQEGDLIIAQKV